jgi:hypothetical protein
MYRLPPQAQVAVVEIEDPYGLSAGERASLVLPRGRKANGSPHHEWRAPEAPKLRVVASLRGDVLTAMHARRQITALAFRAGREYQALCQAAARAGTLKSRDPTAPRIDHGHVVEPVNDRQLAARDKLRRIDGQLPLQFGIGCLLVAEASCEARNLFSTARLSWTRWGRQAPAFSDARALQQ